MSKKFGFDLLREQATDLVLCELDLREKESSQESPIERLFELAMYCHVKYERGFFSTLSGLAPADYEDLYLGSPASLSEALLYQRQVQLEDWRVDFVFYVRGGRVWLPLIVECDGHDFHERTKEQAAKDRGRDRSAQMTGYEIFRFTGSEIWRDPMKCARQVTEWAEAAASR